MNKSIAAILGLLLSLALPAHAAESSKRGGILSFMIPADSPPSFDGHRENTFATIHAVAPFYSVLIRANPDNPADITQFVCDVCTSIPAPNDGGKRYTFPVRGDVRFSDGSAWQPAGTTSLPRRPALSAHVAATIP
jgi:peptide/nickel transport system substrate-binding protein